MNRKLGRRAVAHDARMPKLANAIRWDNLPEPAQSSLTWLALEPKGGIPMLGNDQFGCCVEASMCHYIQMANLYVRCMGDGTPELPTPTEDECLAIYSAITGFDPTNPATDQGTVFLGQGGALEYWVNHGITVGGKLNKATHGATVNVKDQREIKKAIELFGFVFTGATLTEDNVQSGFMWRPDNSPIAGGHEFLTCGYGPGFYQVLTWDGNWRYVPEWEMSHVDEMVIVSDPALFDKHGIDPAGVSLATLNNDLSMLG
jgi:hypothetical protein